MSYVVSVDAESKDVLLLFTEFPNRAKRNKHYAGNSNDKIIEEAKYRINVVLFVQLIIFRFFTNSTTLLFSFR